MDHFHKCKTKGPPQLGQELWTASTNVREIERPQNSNEQHSQEKKEQLHSLPSPAYALPNYSLGSNVQVLFAIQAR